jgi:hypothetical protein
VSPECWIKLFQFVDQEDFERLPKSSLVISHVESATLDLGHLRFHNFFAKEMPVSILSTYFSSLKGLSDDLPIFMRLLRGCSFNKKDDQLKAAFDKILLRSSPTACYIIGELDLVGEYADQIVNLLQSETDTSRFAALEAFKKAKSLPNDIGSRLIKVFNGTHIHDDFVIMSIR